MLRKTDSNASLFVVAALGLFFHRRAADHRGSSSDRQELGQDHLKTTTPPRVQPASWSITPPQEQRGYAIYIREGCKYCHTQQTRTLASDVVRSGWKGVNAPVSTPDEFVYDYRQTFGTKRTGPDLSRIGGKYNKQWHTAHFRNPRDLVPGSIMPPFPWIADNPQELSDLVAYLQTRGRAKDWRPDNDYEK